MTVENKSGFSLRSIIARIIQRRREARTARQLLDLSDTLLRDIGLTRYDVMAGAASSWTRSPERLLSNAASDNRRILAANDASSASVVARVVLAA